MVKNTPRRLEFLCINQIYAHPDRSVIITYLPKVLRKFIKNLVKEQDEIKEQVQNEIVNVVTEHVKIHFYERGTFPTEQELDDKLETISFDYMERMYIFTKTGLVFRKWPRSINVDDDGNFTDDLGNLLIVDESDNVVIVIKDD